MAKNSKTASNSKGHKKTVCPLTRDEFVEGASPLAVTIDGQRVSAGVKEFSTGSFGWNHSGKVTIEIDGVPCVCQVGMNIIVVGSKPGEE